MVLLLSLMMALCICLPGVDAAAQATPVDSAEPLSAEQIQALIERVLENQRKDEAAMDLYDRTERTIVQRGSSEGADDNTVDRVVPMGDSVMRVELERDGKAADPASIERSWREIAAALEGSSDSRWKEASERGRKRRHDRTEMVNAIEEAFAFQWVGRTTENGRVLIELSFVPKPGYKSSARFAALYEHARGKVWIDEDNSQLVRAEAELTSDVSFGGGLIAKIYRGGKLTIEQSEVAPGLWLPTRYTYDFDGRKFLFTMSDHEIVEDSDYRLIGPPKEALAVILREHPGLASYR